LPIKLSPHQCSILSSIIRGWHDNPTSGRSTWEISLTPIAEIK
jgi:hypothetical protein